MIRWTFFNKRYNHKHQVFQPRKVLHLTQPRAINDKPVHNRFLMRVRQPDSQRPASVAA